MASDALPCGCTPEQHTANQACLVDLLAIAYAKGYEAGLYRNLDTHVPKRSRTSKKKAGK